MDTKKVWSGINPVKGVWWTDVPREEKIWITVAFIWCLFLFAMMPIWHLKGGQNPSGIRSKVDPQAFVERTHRFAEEYKIGTEKGFPVVEPPPGADIYMYGRMWSWFPVLKLKKGVEYTLHLSSADLVHGFSLFPINVNFQVIPGYDYALRIVPNQAGDYSIICNEFCGVGHHTMVGKVVVTE